MYSLKVKYVVFSNDEYSGFSLKNWLNLMQHPNAIPVRKNHNSTKNLFELRTFSINKTRTQNT